MFTGQNIVVLDLEVLRSPEDCRHCGKSAHTCTGLMFDTMTGRPQPHGFSALGWDDKSALGLSIGAYYDYQDSQVHWFDLATLDAVMEHLVQRQALLVSFNGIQFDFPLMRGLLRRQADDPSSQPTMLGPQFVEWQHSTQHLCDQFKALCASSYDLLAEIWRADSANKFGRGLNSLDAVCQANGLGAKTGTGAEAPRWWQQGRIAEVLNYCQQDVLLTKALLEYACARQGQLQRNGSGVTIRYLEVEAGHVVWRLPTVRAEV